MTEPKMDLTTVSMAISGLVSQKMTGRVTHWQCLAVVMRRAGQWYADPNPMPRFRIWRWWP